MDISPEQLDSVKNLCKLYKVKRLFAFGSVVSGHFNDESDIDLIVEFRSLDIESYASNYYNFKEALERLFQRPIDLLEQNAIHNPFLRSSIDKSKHKLYG